MHTTSWFISENGRVICAKDQLPPIGECRERSGWRKLPRILGKALKLREDNIFHNPCESVYFLGKQPSSRCLKSISYWWMEERWSWLKFPRILGITSELRENQLYIPFSCIIGSWILLNSHQPQQPVWKCW